MIKLLIFGQKYWGLHVAKAVNQHAADVCATFIRQGEYVRLLARPPGSDHLVIMRMGYRVGGTTLRGRLFDAYWALLRTALADAAPSHYWLGDDVMNTLREAEAGTLRSGALSSTRDELHIAAAPWLARELNVVGIHAETAYVPGVADHPPIAPLLPAEFRVLTYLPAAHFEFYGGDTILEVARRLPNIPFDVVANNGAAVRTSPSNIHWHGWVSDMAEAYKNATVVVRIPRHDAIGGTVVEGLLYARHIIYTYEVPFVRRVFPATPEAVVDALESLYAHHVAGRLGLNIAGRAYALAEFDNNARTDRLISLIRTIG